MMEILNHHIYVCMYYTTRILIFLVYKVYMRSCRISIMNSVLKVRKAGDFPLAVEFELAIPLLDNITHEIF